MYRRQGENLRSLLRKLRRGLLWISRKTRLYLGAAPILAWLCRTGYPPSAFWKHLVGFVCEDFHPDQPQKIRLPLPQHKEMFLSLDLRDPFSQWLYYFGTHEPHTTAFLKRRFQDPALRVVYDIGSNIGYYAVMAAVMLQGKGRVEAFEPVPWIYACLQANAVFNHLSNLKTHPLAVAQTCGKSTLFLPHGAGRWSTNATLSLEFARYCTPTGPMDSLSASTVSLDEWIRRGEADPPHLVRMDIEGGEPLALHGMRECLERCAPDIVVEVLPQTEAELGKLFRNLGYETYWIDPDGWLERQPLTYRPRHFDYYITRKPARAYVRSSKP